MDRQMLAAATTARPVQQLGVRHSARQALWNAENAVDELLVINVGHTSLTCHYDN